MIINNLQQVIDKNQGRNSLYVRNLLKEQLQLYVLNFIYNSDYGKNFLFRGGTALRFCFDLPRLSEDLDFDMEGYDQFELDQFIQDITRYFESKLKFSHLTIKFSGKNKLIYLQFPILSMLNYPVNLGKPNEKNLFLRIDLAPIVGIGYSRELSLMSMSDFSFLIQRYALADLYASKIATILTRERWQGNTKEARFKWRDYFDLFWFHAKGIQPNKIYLKSLLKVDSEHEIFIQLKVKLKEAVKRRQELKQDLLPFFLESEFVNNFIDNLEVYSNSFTMV